MSVPTTNLECAACNAPLRVSADQLGHSVRCPSCRAVMEVHRSGAVTETMVSCPGCHSKLVIPAITDARAFRCPKCRQFLAPFPSAVEVGDVGDLDWASGQGPGLITPDPLASPGGGLAHPSTQRRKRYRLPSSTRSIAYSERVASVAPGAILLGVSIIGVLINAGHFFYAMGITDPELLAEAGVRQLKTKMMLVAILSGGYLLAIAIGSLQMILRQRIWWGRTACVLAALPITLCVFSQLWIGTIGYLVMLPAAIWGSIVLWTSPAP